MFEAILISAGGVWLALFMLVCLVAMIISIENDSFFMGSVSILVTAGVSQFVFGIPVLSSIVYNPFLAIFFLIFYTAVGSAYAAFWRLPNFLQNRQTDIEDEFLRYSKDSNVLTPNTEDFMNSSYYKRFTVSHNKDAVASWVLLWPVGMLWELSHKPIRWIWNQVYYGLGDAFEKINRRTTTKILNKKQ